MAERDDCRDPVERIDMQRLLRHEELMDMCRKLPLDEILADVELLVQLVRYRLRQEKPS